MSTTTTPAGAAALPPVTGTVGLGALVRAELIKIRTTRLWWGLLLVGVLLVAAFTALFAALAGAEGAAGEGGVLSGPDDPAALRTIYGTGFTSGYIYPLVIGIIGMTGEYRHMTITPTLLAIPRRGRLVAAKFLAYFATGLAYGTVLTVAAVAAGGLVLAIRGYSLGLGAEGVPRTLALGLLGCGVWAIFGLGLGTLIRNQVVAIIVALAFVFFLEPLLVFVLNAVEWGAVAQFLPGAASAAITAGDDGGAGFDQLPWWGGALVLAAYGLILGAVGALLTTRRDVT
jgi:ABC-type transport system involved in multi-copper enzyme maturation permease subunit